MFNKIEVSMKKDQGLNFTICVALYQALKKMKVLIQKKKRKKLYRRFKLSRYYIKRKTTFTSHYVHMGKQKEGFAFLGSHLSKHRRKHPATDMTSFV